MMKRRKIRKAIYVQQYGDLWRFTPARWRRLVRSMSDGARGYDLDEAGGKHLTRRPSTLYRTPTGGFDSADPNVRVVSPLNWEEDDWGEEREEMDRFCR